MDKEKHWKLVNSTTGKPIEIGDFILTFRKEPCKVIRFQPPHKPSSTGTVYAEFSDGDRTYHQGVYPSVIGAKYIQYDPSHMGVGQEMMSKEGE